MKNQNRTRTGVLAAMLLAVGTPARAKVGESDIFPLGETKGESLAEVGSAEGENLGAVVGIEISPDGRHAYAASWQANSVTSFKRDPHSGRLKEISSLVDAKFRGAACVRVSPDGSKVALASFRAPGVALFSRDKATGKIELLQALVNGDGGINSLGFAIEVAFSKDSKFLYTLGSSAVSVFDVSANALKLVEVLENDPLRNQLSGGRGLELAPDGKALYAACYSSNTLVKFDIDVTTGKLTEKQVIRDGEGGVTGIEGIFNVACSPDGRHVYTASGRFRGDNAVSAFSVGRDGTLNLKQELFDGDGQLEDYEGGNEITVSPDGLDVYSVASNSDTLVHFKRDQSTGKLGVFKSFQVGAPDRPGAAGVAVSPDGKHVYVADEAGKAVVIYKHVGD